MWLFPRSFFESKKRASMNDSKSKIEKAQKKFREKRLTFEHIRSLPGKENIPQKEYEELVHVIEELTLMLAHSYLRKRSSDALSETDTE